MNNSFSISFKVSVIVIISCNSRTHRFVFCGYTVINCWREYEEKIKSEVLGMGKNVYYPLQECQTDYELINDILEKLNVDSNNKNIVIQALYDSYVDYKIFMSAKETFLNITSLPYYESATELVQKIYLSEDPLYKEKLLLLFWAYSLWGHDYSTEKKTMFIDLLGNSLIFYKWAASKQVYIFDTTLQESLLNTKLPEVVEASIFTNLPYDFFYIDMEASPIKTKDQRNDLMGLLISITHSDAKYTIFGSAFYDLNTKKVVKSFGIDLPINTPINNALSTRESFINLAHPISGESLFEENKIAIKLLLYIATKKPDIKENVKTHQTYHPGKEIQNNYREIRKWDVGFEIGSHIRNYENLANKQRDVKKRPHLRKGHWHHYWYGKRGEQSLRLLWVSTCAVNCGYDLEDIPEFETKLEIPEYQELKEDLRKNEEKADELLKSELNSMKEYKSFDEYSKLPQKRSGKKQIDGRINVYPRNKNTALNALKHAHFSCEIDETHESFIKIKPEVKYMEAHHLVPMAYQDLFDNSLDREQNIVSLCSNCHNEIHYGKNRKVLVQKLYEARKYDLAEAGINITLQQLLKMY